MNIKNKRFLAALQTTVFNIATVPPSLVTSGLVFWLSGADCPQPITNPWIDKSGNSHNVTLYNFTSDPRDGSGNVIVDGVAGRGEIASMPHLGSGDFTMNFAGTLNATNVYYMLTSRRLSSSSDYEFILGINNGGAIEFKYSTSGTSSTTMSFPYTFSINTLYDINIVKSGTTVSCYINNTLVGTPTTLSGTLYSSSQPQLLFTSNSGGTYGNFYGGKFRRALQYSKALTLSEIQRNNSVL